MLTTLNNITKSLLAMNPFPNIMKTAIDTISNTDASNGTDNNVNANAPSELSANFMNQFYQKPDEPVDNDIYDTHPYTMLNLETNEPEDFHYLHGEQLSKTYDFCSGSPSTPLIVHICMVGVEFQCNYDDDHLPFLRFIMENTASIKQPIHTITDELSDDISSQDNSSLEDNIATTPTISGGYGSPSHDDIPDLQSLLVEDQPQPSSIPVDIVPSQKDAIITFPQCHINCISEDKDNTMESYFQNECKKRVLDFFAIEGYFTKTDDFGERLNKSYRGYKEIGEGEIVAVFDITSFMNIPLRKSKNPIWIVVDDLLAKVLPISPKVFEFFEQNPYMKEIRDTLNTPVEIPKTAYLYNIETSQYMTQSDKSDWIDPRSHHKTYGSFYYFKLSGDGTFNTNRKSIVFLKNYADFLENDTSVELMGEHIESSPPDNKRTPELGTSEGGRGLSSPDNSPLPKVEGRKNKKTKDEVLLIDNEPANNPGEYDKEPIANNLPFISVIMFTENGEPTYCVKTESIFMEL